MEKEHPSSSVKKDGTRVFKKASPNGKLEAREQAQAADGRPAVEDLSFGPGLSPAPRPSDVTGLGVEEEGGEGVWDEGGEVVRSGGGEGVRSAGGGGVRSGGGEG